MSDTEQIIDQLVRQHDQTTMPIPDFENQPDLLISKVRKHYMEYLIKLLSMNYETNQKLVNKNIYLPSAIWRCAKNIETAAAQTCMLVQLYRQNIMTVIKQLKNDTKKCKLNRKLYECLHTPPTNEKKIQTTLELVNECTCECHCQYGKKRRKTNHSSLKSKIHQSTFEETPAEIQVTQMQSIPVIINSRVDSTLLNSTPQPEKVVQTIHNPNDNSNLFHSSSTRLSVESQGSDELMMQLEKLFHADPNDDDLFDTAFCDIIDSTTNESNLKKPDAESNGPVQSATEKMDSSIIENHAMQIKSLDERLASLAGLLTNNSTDSNNLHEPPEADTSKPTKRTSSKWLCEEYFLKTQFYELMNEIGDGNRKKLARIKQKLSYLFGEDSDDEGVLSPFEETAEFVTSCKERIAPWVVQLLTPYYIKGRIRGKALFKSLAKHLIRLIYQCSRYPQQYEVQSFVTDFLESHKMIRCEADFKQFRIDNF